MKNTKRHLRRNHTRPSAGIVSGHTAIGGSHPPRNRMVVMAHMVAIATYSPSMNSMYGVDPYSTMKPATSSDSASTRSNGGRLVSASAEMKNTMNIGNSGSQNHPNMPKEPFCASTMSVSRNEPTQSSTVIIT